MLGPGKDPDLDQELDNNHLVKDLNSHLNIHGLVYKEWLLTDASIDSLGLVLILTAL